MNLVSYDGKLKKKSRLRKKVGMKDNLDFNLNIHSDQKKTLINYTLLLLSLLASVFTIQIQIIWHSTGQTVIFGNNDWDKGGLRVQAV